MTVKSLSPTAKDQITNLFLQKAMTLTQLAHFYDRSRRTIIRALEERGVDPGVKTRKKRAPVQPIQIFPFPIVLPTTPISTKSKPRWDYRVLDWVANKLFGGPHFTE